MSAHREMSAPHAPPDDETIRRLTRAIARGDPDAFAEFYERWFERAYLLSRSLTRRDEAFCLDVVQDAMLRVVRHLRPLGGEAELTRWMTRVIRTTAIDLLRRESRRARHERDAAEAAASAQTRPRSPHEDLEIAERIEWIEARLAELDPADRDVLDMRYRDGKTLAATASESGSSTSTTHGRLRRIVARLREAARRKSAEEL